MPVTGSKESIEFAARHDIPITPGATSRGLREDVIRYYARCLAEHGRELTPDHLSVPANAFVADSKADAVAQTGPHYLYFNRVLFSHGNITETNKQRAHGYVTTSSDDYVRAENRQAAARPRSEFRDLTIDEVTRQAESMPWGDADEVTERLIETAEHAGAGTLIVSLNRGVMPHEMYLEQIRRFAAEVLPRLQAHEVSGATAGAVAGA
jgi:alkanesulfonate monooxygenase SsuD/methylene tetrahydromethanopterin reductase-like flavin-dependent oxidoreductase (luciferase family)